MMMMRRRKKTMNLPPGWFVGSAAWMSNAIAVGGADFGINCIDGFVSVLINGFWEEGGNILNIPSKSPSLLT